jgi:hypothetical protein
VLYYCIYIYRVGGRVSQRQNGSAKFAHSSTSLQIYHWVGPVCRLVVSSLQTWSPNESPNSFTNRSQVCKLDCDFEASDERADDDRHRPCPCRAHSRMFDSQAQKRMSVVNRRIPSSFLKRRIYYHPNLPPRLHPRRHRRRLVAAATLASPAVATAAATAPATVATVAVAVATVSPPQLSTPPTLPSHTHIHT